MNDTMDPESRTTIKWAHYWDIYRRYIQPGMRILEIGVNDGGSLCMWKALGCSDVFGIDIRKCTVPGCHILQSNVCNRRAVVKFLDGITVTSKIDIVIDDGGHRPYQIASAFKTIFPYVKNGGWYCIEDLHNLSKLQWRLWEAFGLPGPKRILKKTYRAMNRYYTDTECATQQYRAVLYPHMLWINKVTTNTFADNKIFDCI